MTYKSNIFVCMYLYRYHSIDDYVNGTKPVFPLWCTLAEQINIKIGRVYTNSVNVVDRVRRWSYYDTFNSINFNLRIVLQSLWIWNDLIIKSSISINTVCGEAARVISSTHFSLRINYDVGMRKYWHCLMVAARFCRFSIFAMPQWSKGWLAGVLHIVWLALDCRRRYHTHSQHA